MTERLGVSLGQRLTRGLSSGGGKGKLCGRGVEEGSLPRVSERERRENNSGNKKRNYTISVTISYREYIEATVVERKRLRSRGTAKGQGRSCLSFFNSLRLTDQSS